MNAVLTKIKIAADLGDPWAQYQLGQIYEHGWYGTEKSRIRSLVWYQRAADQGCQPAQGILDSVDHRVCAYSAASALYSRASLLAPSFTQHAST